MNPSRRLVGLILAFVALTSLAPIAGRAAPKLKYCIVRNPPNEQCEVHGSTSKNFRFSIVAYAAYWDVSACGSEGCDTQYLYKLGEMNGKITAPGNCPCEARLVLQSPSTPFTASGVGLGILMAVPA